MAPPVQWGRQPLAVCSPAGLGHKMEVWAGPATAPKVRGRPRGCFTLSFHRLALDRGRIRRAISCPAPALGPGWGQGPLRGNPE